MLILCIIIALVFTALIAFGTALIVKHMIIDTNAIGIILGGGCILLLLFIGLAIWTAITVSILNAYTS